MAEAAQTRMTADEFVAWAAAQPKGRRYELYGGEIVAMAPERLSHALAKGTIYRRLAEAVETAGLPCMVVPDGMAVAVDTETTFEPLVQLRCGEALPGDTLRIIDPMLVVEVLSPSTRGVDATSKLIGYFRIPSLHHYLLVDADRRVLVHHRRGEGGEIVTRILPPGPLRLDPPGVTFDPLA